MSVEKTTNGKPLSLTWRFSFFSYGFRPFFLLASMWAALAIPFWMSMYSGFISPEFFPNPVSWHSREMIFGFVSAAMAGFLLTAVPNWTGRPAKQGVLLFILVVIWILGRLSVLFLSENEPLIALFLDISFPIIIGVLIGIDLWKTNNKRNFPIVVLLFLFGLASGINHYGNMENNNFGELGLRFGIGIAIFMISIIGGRIIPAFTTNWLKQKNKTNLPAVFSLFDKITLASSALVLLLWIVFPDLTWTGWFFVFVSALHLIRLMRWQGLSTLEEPLLFILHVGYIWLPLSLFLVGLSILNEDILKTVGIHAMTAGAIGTMVLAVMVRALKGHTGQALKSDIYSNLIFLSVTIGALMRVLYGLNYLENHYFLISGGVLWSGGYFIFMFTNLRALIFQKI